MSFNGIAGNVTIALVTPWSQVRSLSGVFVWCVRAFKMIKNIKDTNI